MLNLIRPLRFLAILALSACTAVPERTRDPWTVSFLQACKDATTDALVINLAAHPDDEAARTLVYLRRQGVRTLTIYSTCGGGGQNAIGREIGPALAFLRTRETLAAARFTGTKVRWLGFSDFGYSKTAAETFEVWGKEAYMRELDKVVTAEHPDIAFTNHSPDRGHGHHRATVMALQELMESKARDGWIVPVYRRGFRNAEDWQIKFGVGGVDPVAGQSYARQAYRGWRQHRTQGAFGPFTGTRLLEDKWGIVHPKDADGGQLLSYLGSVFEEPGFLELAQREGIDIQNLRVRFDAFGVMGDQAKHIARARDLLPKVVELREKLANGSAAIRLSRRIDALQRIVMLGAGVTITGQLSQERLAPGTSGFLYLRVTREGSMPPRRLSAELLGRRAVGHDGHVRVPFGPLKDVSAGDVKPGWFHPTVNFDVDGVPISRRVPVRYTPVERVALKWQRGVRMVPAGQIGGRIDVPIEITWNGDQEVTAALKLTSSSGVVAELSDASVRLPAKPTQHQKVVSIVFPERALREDVTVVSSLETGSSPLHLRLVDANPPKQLKVGLIRGPDDSLQLALQDLRISYVLLDDDRHLDKVDLSAINTIVLDIRAYHHRREFLKSNRDRILEHCKAGGRVVSFYHKPLEWNPTEVKPALSPFELLVGRRRVCEEKAAVTFIDPKHRILNVPNKLGPEDFKGWVQERGLNFPSKWSSEWTPILRMNDTGERPLDGALLYARYGAGDYVYCSLALYRQLRRGHAGAARILVNLLSQ
ncbi:MAG: PIG-L family deacetylase [Planctomycetota bacterium]|nr:PIG-L family deacetylase [Planctomycetota bacterium]